MPKVSSYSGFTPILTDLLYGVDDPGGTPVSNKCTFADARTLIEANLVSPVIAAAANTAALAATGYSLTGTDATSMIDLAGTWNTSGTPTAIKLNVTDTASNAASKLLDLQVGGETKFRVEKDGFGVFNSPTASEVHRLEINYAAVQGYRSNNPTAALRSIFETVWRHVLVTKRDDPIIWSPNSETVATIDVQLFGSQNLLEQRNGTNAQTFNVYNTFTDASNYERLRLGWSSNIFEIGSEAAGTGTLRGIQIGISGNSIGFHGATPVAQQATNGTTAGFVAGVGTAVNDDSTFTGGIAGSPSTGYTISDIVLALKNYGLLAE